jgi:hypothetical protein
MVQRCVVEFGKHIAQFSIVSTSWCEALSIGFCAMCGLVCNPKSVLNQRAGLLRAHVRLRRYAKRLGAARKIRLTTYICYRAQKEAHMLTSRARQELSALSIGSSIGTVLGLPPKDPDNDDDEDEEDDEDESEEEPAVVREPDE